MYEESLPKVIEVSTSETRKSIENIPPVLHAGGYLLELALMGKGGWKEISQPGFLKPMYLWRNL